jgi:hypothetical protein
MGWARAEILGPAVRLGLGFLRRALLGPAQPEKCPGICETDDWCDATGTWKVGVKPNQWCDAILCGVSVRLQV